MNISIIDVPYNLDQYKVGMGQAPAALADAGLARRLTGLGHDLTHEVVAIAESDESREMRIGRLQARLAASVARAISAGRMPLIVGGDCLVSLGALAGLGRPNDTGVVWIDAHGDFNTPEISVSGYLGGMPLACAVGRGLADLRQQCELMPLAERNVALVGVRDLDPLEERALAASSVMLVRTSEIGGDATALDRTLHALARLTQVYLHIDIDVLDAAEAPGVDFPTAPGLALPQLERLAQQAASLGNLAALALTAVNPEKDTDGRTVRAALQVIEAALA